MAGRLIVVSNRLADFHKPAAGGLAVALSGILRHRGGVWLGWSGKIVNRGKEDAQIIRTAVGNVEYLSIDLNEEEFNGYYKGYANATLWPILHHRVDLAKFDKASEKIYRLMNARFAKVLLTEIQDDDVVWVHDYHLIPLGEELRAAGKLNKVGFFLHTPLPPSAILATLPNNSSLLSSLFSYDLIGFQSQEDKRNFLNYVEWQFGKDSVEGSKVIRRGKSVVGAFPIGIDVCEFQSIAQSKTAQAMRDGMREEYSKRQLVVGVDRLDYSKGIPHRVHSFGEFLHRFPQMQRSATLIQIASPSRGEIETYADIQRELEALCGSVNGDLGELDWMPVRYIHKTLCQEELAGLYQAAKVALVTPLRDGMNLVAKEFVAAQNPYKPGVLVLSRFAGVAEQMPEALIVNPYDTESVAYAIHRALVMPLAERQERHRALLGKIKDNDLHWWCRSFLQRLTQPEFESRSIKSVLKNFRARLDPNSNHA